MRKSRKSAIIKRVVRSVSHMNKFVPTFGSGLNNAAELSLMAREEWEQRLVDNFWGLDKDLRDRNQEITLMTEEDRRSSLYESQLRIQQLHQLWDDEFGAYEQQQREIHRRQTAILRTDHLKLINSPVAVEDVIKFLWSSGSEGGQKSIQQVIPPTLKDTVAIGLNGIGASQSHSLDQGVNGLAPSNSTIATASLDSVHMSLHLDGLQRSREILDNAKTSYRHILKELKSLDLVPPNTTGLPYFRNSKSSTKNGSASQVVPQPGEAAFANNNPATTTAAGNIRHAASVFSSEESQAQNKSIYSAVQEVSSAMGYSTTSATTVTPPPVYNDALEGHPVYKWDQETMIQSAFRLLDRGNKGYLTKEDLSLIASDRTVHQLLQYTVFWSVIKRREWNVLETLLTTAVAENTAVTTPAHPSKSFALPPLLKQKSTSSIRSSHSAQGGIAGHRGSAIGGDLLHGSSLATSQTALSGAGGGLNHPSMYKFSQQPVESISYFQFLDCAYSLSKQLHCAIDTIRTQEEHEYYTSLACGPRRQQFPSTYYDQEHNGIIRHFRMMRKLAIGDCVWGLHRQGVRWLPAVIMKIYYPKEKRSLSSNGLGGGDDNESLMSMIPEEETQNRNNNNTNNNHNSITSNSYYYYYDLWFPLNEKDLAKAKLMNTSRQLLTLPSQSTSLTTSPFASTVSDTQLVPHRPIATSLWSKEDSVMTHPHSDYNHSHINNESYETIQYLSSVSPKPFDSEKQVCSYAFDLIDSNACGIINLLLLIQSMQSKELLQIVNTSLVLSLIFRTNQTLEEILLSKEDALQQLLALEQPGIVTEGTTNTNNEIDNNSQVVSTTSKSAKPATSIFPIPCFLPVFIDTFTQETEEDEETREAIERITNRHSPTINNQDSSTVFMTNVPETEKKEGDSLTSDNSYENDHWEEGEAKQFPSHQVRSEEEQEQQKLKKLQQKVNQISSEFLSKMDFLEFCDAVYNVIKYDFQFHRKGGNSSDVKLFSKLKKRKTRHLR